MRVLGCLSPDKEFTFRDTSLVSADMKTYVREGVTLLAIGGNEMFSKLDWNRKSV